MRKRRVCRVAWHASCRQTDVYMVSDGQRERTRMPFSGCVSCVMPSFPLPYWCAVVPLARGVAAFSDFVQRLADVVKDVFHVLDTYRQTDEVGRNACFAQLFVTQLAVGVACGMKHTSACIRHVCDDVD